MERDWFERDWFEIEPDVIEQEKARLREIAAELEITLATHGQTEYVRQAATIREAIYDIRQFNDIRQFIHMLRPSWDDLSGGYECLRAFLFELPAQLRPVTVAHWRRLDEMATTLGLGEGRAEAEDFGQPVDRSFLHPLHHNAYRLPLELDEADIRAVAAFADEAFQRAVRISRPLPERLNGSAYSCYLNDLHEVLADQRPVRWIPRAQDVFGFNTLRLACESALKRQLQVAPYLVQLLLISAHELRRGGSSGFHGRERLRAKLVGGHLIGDLSTYDLNSALALSDLAIESRVFCRSQILYTHESDPAVVRRLLDHWQALRHLTTNPSRAGIAQIDLELRACLRLLLPGQVRQLMAEAHGEIGSAGRSDIPEDTTVKDCYIGRLARTCTDYGENQRSRELVQHIQDRSIRAATEAALSLAASERGDLDVAEDFRARFIYDHPDTSSPGQNVSIAALELRRFPRLWGYPDFPAERWDDLHPYPYLEAAEVAS